MKKTLTILLLALTSTGIFGAPGDTTWVQANNVQLNYYNNFDSTILFPNGSLTYRKIIMLFTLGEYNCPVGSQYCHQWDYTVTNYVMTHTDTFELSRFITPYANTGVPRFPSNWKQYYAYDVTDFYPYLKDSAKIRINYSGYSGGFTANIKFAFIEGVPERNVFHISELWRGGYTFGNTADPIANHIPVKSLTATTGSVFSNLKYTVTGHGSDNTTQCCEFASHTYSVTLNGSVINQTPIWRTDCGLNELYPQGGTWIYNRGNWCPGDAVKTNTHPLPGVTGGTTYSLGINYDNYTSTGNYGMYAMEGHVVDYGNYNHTLDASLNDILSPSNYEDHFRENPSGNMPVVKVHNSGSDTIRSIQFSYGVKDSAAIQYVWNGVLPTDVDTLITLPVLNSLTRMSQGTASGTFQFIAKILNVNGSADQDTTNNIYRSNFIVAPLWPSVFLAQFNTNSEGVSGVGTNPSETSWQITDMNNTVVASHLNANVSTNYMDTVVLSSGGFYKLTITDLGCDGLHWWVWDQNPQYGITAGSFGIRKMNLSTIYMNGYNYSGTFNNDFGCGFTQFFTTSALLNEIHQNAARSNVRTLDTYPNPAQDFMTLQFSGGSGQADGTIELVDAQGKIVYAGTVNTNQSQMSLSSLMPGIYSLLYRESNNLPIMKRVSVIK